MTRKELEQLLDAAADDALRARGRIEGAVENGDVPAWILEALSELERASMHYGEAAARLDINAALSARSRASSLH